MNSIGKSLPPGSEGGVTGINRTPEISAKPICASGEGRAVHTPRERSVHQRELMLRSPVHFMRQNGLLSLRRRMDGEATLEFEIFEELWAEGMTDYAARILPFGTKLEAPQFASTAPVELGASPAEPALEGVFFSAATDAPGGFDDGQLEQSAVLLTPLALAVDACPAPPGGGLIISPYVTDPTRVFEAFDDSCRDERWRTCIEWTARPPV